MNERIEYDEPPAGIDYAKPGDAITVGPGDPELDETVSTVIAVWNRGWPSALRLPDADQ